ncbi:MAG TPA: PIN domain-containing protein [Sphingopyxis sp.]|nr:PIN domain-containing protein [Sphingopyxis sp.]
MLIGRYSAFLDANVLHPAFLRGALLWFADERLFRPVWSAHVLAEWRSSVERRRKDLEPAALDRMQAAAVQAFPDAEVAGYDALIDGLSLPDPDDRHVLAAAIVGRCHGIITANLKDFPEEEVARFSMEVIHPDAFIVNIIDLEENRALAACKRHRAAMSKSLPTADDYLDQFERSGLIQAHQRLIGRKDLL